MQIEHQLPTELWIEILKPLTIYDVILFRSSCKELRALAKRFKPFSPYFALNHQKCVEYFALLGSVSCLEYLQSLGIDIDSNHLADLVAREGKTQQHVEVLKFCEKQAELKFSKLDLARKCMGTHCNFTMLKYLCESIPVQNYSVLGRLYPKEAAALGHYDCMKLLLETGFTFDSYVDKRGIYIQYTPSVECLQFYLSQKHYWQDNFIADAAADGRLDMIKIAQLKGASDPHRYTPIKVATVECAEHLFKSYGRLYTLTTVIKKENFEVAKYLIENDLLHVKNHMIQDAFIASQEMYELLLNAFSAQGKTFSNPADKPIFSEPLQHGDDLFGELIAKNDVKTFEFAASKWPLSPKQYENCLLQAIYHTKDFGEDKDDIENLLAQASRNQNFDALVYLHKIGCKWESKVCDYAGNLLCLKYAREHGCPWTDGLYDYLFGDIEKSDMKHRARVELLVNIPMLRYAVWNGCPMTSQARENIEYLIKLHPSLNIRFKPKK